MPDKECETCDHYGCSINLYGVGEHKQRGIACGDQRCCNGELDERARGYERDEAEFILLEE